MPSHLLKQPCYRGFNHGAGVLVWLLCDEIWALGRWFVLDDVAINPRKGTLVSMEPRPGGGPVETETHFGGQAETTFLPQSDNTATSCKIVRHTAPRPYRNDAPSIPAVPADAGR